MTGSIPQVHFDARDFPEAQRFTIWRQMLSSNFDISLTDSLPEDFTGTSHGWAIGRLLFTRSTMPAMECDRNEVKIQGDPSDHCIFMHLMRGSMSGDFDGRRVACESGGTYVMDTNRPFRSRTSSADTITVSVPRLLLEAATRTTASFHGTTIDGALGRLLSNHLKSTIAIASDLTPAEASVVEHTTVQLLGASLLVHADRTRKGQPLLVLAVRNDIQRYVEENLHRADLGPATICEALGLSRSTAYRAFEGTAGIAKYIQQRRLLAARSLLSHPQERRAIAEIAIVVGYRDPAQFSRAYRRAFGFAPSETRDMHGGDLSYAELSTRARRDDFHRWVEDLRIHIVQSESA